MKKLTIIMSFLLISGCTNYYRNLQGTSMSIGISLPQEEIIQIQALNYLSGSKVTVKDPSIIRHKYKVTETNSYFGCITTIRNADCDIEVIPSTNNIEKIERND